MIFRRLAPLSIATALGALAVFAALLCLHGCAEQELYQPLDSQFDVVGQIELPTQAEDVDVLGQYAYVAAGESGLQIVDISDPAHPRRVSWADTDKFSESVIAAQTYDSDGSPRQIAFVMDGTEGILTFDITDPDSIVDFQQGTQAYDGKGLCFTPPRFITEPYMLFMADSWRGVTAFLQIMDTPGALDFELAGTRRIFTYGYTKNLVYVDGYLYVAEDQMGVTVVDATAMPSGGLVLGANFDTPGYALDLAYENGYLFIADSDHGMEVMKITDGGTQLALVANLPLMGDCCAIEVANGVAFLAADDAGLHVVDIRDPEHPEWLGNVPTSEAVGVAVGEDNIVCVADLQDGLVVFRGPDLPTDTAPPAKVADLDARLTSVTALTLSWTAPSDAGSGVNLYDVRWSDTPIDEANWGAATVLTRRPLPLPAGHTQTLELDGLAAGAGYYFALKSCDCAGNWSELSNIALARMTTPTLSDPAVDPPTGDISTRFTYAVVYSDPEGEPPAVHDALIDGVAHAMAAADTATDYVAGVRYTVESTLGWGSHEYSFSFDDGHGPVITTPIASGPLLPADPFPVSMSLVDIASGRTFTMGSPTGEVGRDSDETAHEVTLTRSFYMLATEVSQTLYSTVMGYNPSSFLGVSRPVETVTWYDAVAFCNALSEHDGYLPAYTISQIQYDAENHIVGAIVTWDREANGYRLPTEAEWEYACRAGSTTSLANGELTYQYCENDAGHSLLDAIGWYCGNADVGTGRKPQDVGGKSPNAFGLLDMHGNVWEFCWDWYDAYPQTAISDPIGPDGPVDGQRVRRGGCWDYYARDCRSASRGEFYPNSADDTSGFRVVRNAE